MTSSMSRRSLFAATGAVLSVALAACTANDPLAQQAAAGDNKGFVAGDGSVTEYALAKRSDPVEFSGKLFDGTTITAASVRGKVTILNFWYAACSPCRLEAPSLQSLYSEFKAQGVDFFGVNIRDEVATAEAFERTFKIGYPSIMDKDGGVLLALSRRNLVPPAAVPTTLVLDRQGRVSARILGTADKSTLKALITSTLAEK
ncbi:TlpA family protein disulfide reductase [Arthrobacter silviterrae]|uniref:TlpA family protein disulfide reductase n=2 Tax=Arthrobacter TaxID=1663 RepID=A0ABX0DHT2_9MICC|nr:TlpA family protein disulfide reductase [Arthrobacter silviterrae]